jgi:hypothetical protein
LTEEPQFRQATSSSFLGAVSANAGNANDNDINNAGIKLESTTSTSIPVSFVIVSDSQDVTPAIVPSGKVSLFSPSVLVGENIRSDLVSDLSALSTSDISNEMPGIVSVSELSNATVVQSIIDQIDCPPGMIIWLGDTGASQHSSSAKNGARNVRASGQTSLGATGQPVVPECTFDLAGQFVNADGSLGLEAVITEVSYNSRHNFNLFSISRMLQLGWTLSGNKQRLTLNSTDGKSVIHFDIVIKTKLGAVYLAKFAVSSEVSAASTAAGTRMNINRAHQLLGHKSEANTRATAKALGLTISRGSMEVCEACALAKAKQKGVPKKPDSAKVEIPFQRIHTDISQVKVLDSEGNGVTINKKSWIIRVDAATGKKWSQFVTKKSDFVDTTLGWLGLMTANDMHVSSLRMDPSGENQKLAAKLLAPEYFHLQPINTELTPRDSPQYNSLAETAYPYLAGMARAAMAHANIPREVRPKISIEVLMTVTLLDGLTVIPFHGVQATRDMIIYGENPKWASNLHVIGEAAVVKEGKDGKSGDRGITMMFVGPAIDRTSDTYRFWNETTNRIITSRDAMWLGRLYFSPRSSSVLVEDEEIADPGDQAATDDGSDDDEPVSTGVVKSVKFADALIQEASADEAATSGGSGTHSAATSTATTTRSGRVTRAPARLGDYETTLGNMPEAFQGPAVQANYIAHMLELDQDEFAMTNFALPSVGIIDITGSYIESELDPEVLLVGAGSLDGFEHTDELRVMNYKEAMASDPVKWKEAVRQEYLKFEKFKVLRAIPKKDLPRGEKVLETVWACKLKSNGTPRARMNARGYMQVEGEHYVGDSISSPVSNPQTVRIMLTLVAMNPVYECRIIDIEGAFLQGQFRNGERMFIEVPDGMEEYYGSKQDTVCEMLVPLYGTKQAAECFYQTLRKKVEKLGYSRSKADFTLFFRWVDGRLTAFVTWVDDILAIGCKMDLDTFEAEIKSELEAKAEPVFEEYLGNAVTIKRDSSGLGEVKFTQPVLLQKLKDNFPIEDNRIPRTPAAPGSELSKDESSPELSKEEAFKFRSMLATLMHMQQWSRPDILHAVRALARYMHAPREVHLRALKYLLAYLYSTLYRGLSLRPIRIWDGSEGFEFVISGRSDSNYAANVDDRRSVTGCRTALEGAPIMQRSATQRHVTLSVTEAETAAGVTEAQDMVYSHNVLTSLGLKVKLPMVLEMDNKGAVDLANSLSVGGRTRHVEVRNHYLREMKDVGMIVIKHIPGDDNEADIFTKNTSTATFCKHVVQFVGHDEYVDAVDGGAVKPPS